MAKDYRFKKRGQVYYYKFYHEENFHTTGCKDEKKAEEYVEKLMRGKIITSKRIPLFYEFAKDFFIWGKCAWTIRQVSKNRSFSKSHAKDRRTLVEKYLIPHWGKRLITTLEAEEIDEWLLGLNLSNQSKNHIIFALRTILKEAKRKKIISHNIAYDIETYSVNPKERDIFIKEELQRLFPLNDDEFKSIWKGYEERVTPYYGKSTPSYTHTQGGFIVGIMCYLMVTSGIRHSEARALKWKDIDQENKVIKITKTLKRDNSVGPTKNKEKRISILTERAIHLLTKLKENSPYIKENDFIFTLTGKPFWTNYTYNMFKKALAEAAIDTDGRNIVVHSFRHTYVTKNRDGLFDETILQKTAGHNSKEVTDGYDHQQLTRLIKQIAPHQEKFQEIWSFLDIPKTNNQMAT